MSCEHGAETDLGRVRQCERTPRPKEHSMNSWYQWSAPVRNLTWVAAHFGHR